MGARTVSTAVLAEKEGDVSEDKYDAELARKQWSERFGVKVGGRCTSPARRLGRKPPSGWPEWSLPRAFDHTFTLTRKANGIRGVLTMPYGLDADRAEELTRWTQAVDAYWYVIGEGWWHPGTIAIVIWPNDPARS